MTRSNDMKTFWHKNGMALDIRKIQVSQPSSNTQNSPVIEEYMKREKPRAAVTSIYVICPSAQYSFMIIFVYYYWRIRYAILDRVPIFI